MKLDLLDRHLMRLLDIDARTNLMKLAGSLRCSRETVNYRIKRLQKLGVIRGFKAKINRKLLGLMTFRAYISLDNSAKHARLDELVKNITSKKYVTWFASLSGEFDGVIEISAKNMDEFDCRLFEILKDTDGMIGSSDVIIEVWGEYLGRKYLWDANKGKPQKTGNGKAECDSLDYEILAVLSENARMSVADISAAINAKPATVAYRIGKLEESGVIEGYVTDYSNRLLGKTRYKSRLVVKNFSEDVQKQIYDYCRQHPDIVYFSRTVGRWNIEIEADVSDVIDYEEIILDFKSNFADKIKKSDSMTIFREFKWTYWPGSP